MRGQLQIVNGVLSSSDGVNQVTEDDVGDFLVTLERKLDVRCVTLDSKKLSDDSLSILIAVLLRTTQLTTIDLLLNYLSDSSMLLLAKCIPTALPHLTFLNLSNNHVGPDGTVVLARAFFPDFSGSVENEGSLKCTILMSPACWQQPMTTSRNVASRMRDTVYFLNMSDNYIGPDGVLSIAEAIKLHRCRSTVFLQNVKCDSAGALALSATGSLIHGLDLSQNSLEDLHVIDGISCMLSQGTVLESLYLAMLSDNPVSTSQFNRIGKRTIRKEEFFFTTPT
jgi:Ran GTPase-activating protein (RanGAP) involved in mRNA processing and transport